MREIRLIGLREVIRTTGHGKSKIYDGAKAGDFPRPVKSGARSLWVEAEIQEWLTARIAERDAKAAA